MLKLLIYFMIYILNSTLSIISYSSSFSVNSLTCDTFQYIDQINIAVGFVPQIFSPSDNITLSKIRFILNLIAANQISIAFWFKPVNVSSMSQDGRFYALTADPTHDTSADGNVMSLFYASSGVVKFFYSKGPARDVLVVPISLSTSSWYHFYYSSDYTLNKVFGAVFSASSSFAYSTSTVSYNNIQYIPGVGNLLLVLGNSASFDMPYGLLRNLMISNYYSEIYNGLMTVSTDSLDIITMYKFSEWSGSYTYEYLTGYYTGAYYANNVTSIPTLTSKGIFLTGSQYVTLPFWNFAEIKSFSIFLYLTVRQSDSFCSKVFILGKYNLAGTMLFGLYIIQGQNKLGVRGPFFDIDTPYVFTLDVPTVLVLSIEWAITSQVCFMTIASNTGPTVSVDISNAFFNDTGYRGSIVLGSVSCTATFDLRYYQLTYGTNYLHTGANCGFSNCSILIGSPGNYFCVQNLLTTCSPTERIESTLMDCFNCSAFNNCTVCPQHSFLFPLECKAKCYPDITNQICYKCTTGCDVCDATGCLSCMDKYVFYRGVCVDRCPPTMRIDPYVLACASLPCKANVTAYWDPNITGLTQITFLITTNYPECMPYINSSVMIDQNKIFLNNTFRKLSALTCLIKANISINTDNATFTAMMGSSYLSAYVYCIDYESCTDPANPVCYPATGCGTCTSDANCTRFLAQPYCDPYLKQCVECNDDSQCKYLGPSFFCLDYTCNEPIDSSSSFFGNAGQIMVFSTMISSAAIFFLTGKPRLFINIIFILQNFQIIIFLNINYPVNMNQFLKCLNLVMFKFIPNPFTLISTTYDNKMSDYYLPKFMQWGFSGVFIKDYGIFLTIMGLSLSVHLFASFLRCNSLKYLAYKLRENAGYSFAFRLLIATSTTFIQSIGVQLLTFNFDDSLVFYSWIIAVALLFIFIIIIYKTITTYFKMKNASIHEFQQIANKYNFLYQDYDFLNKKIKFPFLAVILLSRLIMTAGLIGLYFYPLQQIVFQVLLAAGYGLIVYQFSPFPDKAEAAVQMVIQFAFVGLLISISMFFLDSAKDSDRAKLIGWFVIFFAMSMLLLFQIYSFYLAYIEYKEYKEAQIEKKGIKKLKIKNKIVTLNAGKSKNFDSLKPKIKQPEKIKAGEIVGKKKSRIKMLVTKKIHPESELPQWSKVYQKDSS